MILTQSPSVHWSPEGQSEEVRQSWQPFRTQRFPEHSLSSRQTVQSLSLLHDPKAHEASSVHPVRHSSLSQVDPCGQSDDERHSVTGTDDENAEVRAMLALERNGADDRTGRGKEELSNPVLENGIEETNELREEESTVEENAFDVIKLALEEKAEEEKGEGAEEGFGAELEKPVLLEPGGGGGGGGMPQSSASVHLSEPSPSTTMHCMSLHSKCVTGQSALVWHKS